MKLITHMKSNYTNALTRCGVIVGGTVHISAAYVRKRVRSFNIVYILRETDTHKFISNKLYFSMNREPPLHVSAVIYSHPEESNISQNV
jgi:sorbitol-specific phosphotransferase system component IIBC